MREFQQLFAPVYCRSNVMAGERYVSRQKVSLFASVTD
jgi:hypothetical protein